MHGDGRGWFKEGFQQAKLSAQGFPPFEIVQQQRVVQPPRSGSRAGSTRSRGTSTSRWLHGRAFAAIVDLRDGPTFGTRRDVRAAPGHRALRARAAAATRYQTLTPDVVYTLPGQRALVADAQYTLVQAFDPALGIDWPIGPDAAIRSDKDSAHPRWPICGGWKPTKQAGRG